MHEVNKLLLQDKRTQLQLSLAIEDWLPCWLPVFNAIKELNKPWSFEYFDCVKQEDLPFWQTALQQTPLAELDIPLTAIKAPDSCAVHHEMEARYASQLAIRYMPALQHHILYEYDVAKILAQAAAALHIPTDDEVYFFYTRFTPVIRLPFSSISLLQEQEIMAPENLCIMPLNYSWLIFRSLEHEWKWGHRPV